MRVLLVKLALLGVFGCSILASARAQEQASAGAAGQEVKSKGAATKSDSKKSDKGQRRLLKQQEKERKAAEKKALELRKKQEKEEKKRGKKSSKQSKTDENQGDTKGKGKNKGDSKTTTPKKGGKNLEDGKAKDDKNGDKKKSARESKKSAKEKSKADKQTKEDKKKAKEEKKRERARKKKEKALLKERKRQEKKAKKLAAKQEKERRKREKKAGGKNKGKAKDAQASEKNGAAQVVAKPIVKTKELGESEFLDSFFKTNPVQDATKSTRYQGLNPDSLELEDAKSPATVATVGQNPDSDATNSEQARSINNADIASNLNSAPGLKNNPAKDAASILASESELMLKLPGTESPNLPAAVEPKAVKVVEKKSKKNPKSKLAKKPKKSKKSKNLAKNKQSSAQKADNLPAANPTELAQTDAADKAITAPKNPKTHEEVLASINAKKEKNREKYKAIIRANSALYYSDATALLTLEGQTALANLSKFLEENPGAKLMVEITAVKDYKKVLSKELIDQRVNIMRTAILSSAIGYLERDRVVVFAKVNQNIPFNPTGARVHFSIVYEQ